MIDVGGAALLGAAARNAAGVAAVAEPGPLPAARRGAARARPRLAGAAGAARRRGIRDRRRLLRRDRRVPQPDLGQHLPERAWRSSSRRSRPALRREPAPARGLLPRDDPSQRHARRRDPAPGRAAVVQQPARPRRGVPDRAATTRRRPSRSSSTPTLSGSPRPTSSSRPTGTRSRPTPSRRSAAIVGVNRELDGATAREIAANSYEAVVAPGYSRRGARHPARRRPASSSWRSRPTRPRACATTASPTSTSSASPAGSWSRASTSSGSTGGQLQVVTKRRPDARRAERPAVRLASRPPRPIERDRARPERGDGRHRRRPGQPPGRRSRSRFAGPATGPRLAVMASDAYFPFPDGIQMAAGPASRRSSSRAARSATRWRSRSPTGITWRWCSRGKRHFRH